MSDMVVSRYGESGWSADVWGNTMAEDMLLRAINFDMATRSLHIFLTYDGYEFEGAPTGDWCVDIIDVDSFSLTRLAESLPPSGSGTIETTAVSGFNYTLFSDEVILRAVAPTARIRRANNSSVRVDASSPRNRVSIQAGDTAEWTIERWGDSGDYVWDCLLEAVRFDVSDRSLMFDVVEVGPDPKRSEVSRFSLTLDRVISFAIASRRKIDGESGLQRLEFGYVDVPRYYLYHPQLMISASVEDE